MGMRELLRVTQWWSQSSSHRWNRTSSIIKMRIKEKSKRQIRRRSTHRSCNSRCLNSKTRTSYQILTILGREEAEAYNHIKSLNLISTHPRCSSILNSNSSNSHPCQANSPNTTPISNSSNTPRISARSLHIQWCIQVLVQVHLKQTLVSSQFNRCSSSSNLTPHSWVSSQIPPQTRDKSRMSIGGISNSKWSRKRTKRDRRRYLRWSKMREKWAKNNPHSRPPIDSSKTQTRWVTKVLRLNKMDMVGSHK